MATLSDRYGVGRVLVTGATGFIGRVAAAALDKAGHEVVRGGRARLDTSASGEAWVAYGEIGPDTCWEQALSGIGTVVHVAGLAHLPDASLARQANAFGRVNAEGTARLATTAARAGVRRLVLVSTALVAGDASPGRPFTESDRPVPKGAYAVSKLASEQRLQEAARGTGLEWVILRPPLVYGPAATGNFRRLAQLVRSGLPLPLGAATARRTFVGVDNFADAVVRCVEHPRAAGEIFFVGDRETPTMAEFVRGMGVAMGREVWLPSVPPALVRTAARVAGRVRDYHRLFDPFEIDSSRIRAALDWSPPLSLDEGLARALSNLTAPPHSKAGSIGTR